MTASEWIARKGGDGEETEEVDGTNYSMIFSKNQTMNNKNQLLLLKYLSAFLLSLHVL